MLAIPAVVLEPGTSASGALSRSWELTRGLALADLRPRASRCCVLLYVPVVAITGLVRRCCCPHGAGEASAGLTGRPWSRLAIGGVVQMFIYPLFYCVLTVTYYDLRVRKEGFDLELLASTLQTA